MLTLLVPTMMLAVPAIAATEDPVTAPPVAVTPAKKPSKKICRNVETSASRLGSRICKTAEQWQADAARDSDGIAGNRKGG